MTAYDSFFGIFYFFFKHLRLLIQNSSKPTKNYLLVLVCLIHPNDTFLSNICVCFTNKEMSSSSRELNST